MTCLYPLRPANEMKVSIVSVRIKMPLQVPVSNLTAVPVGDMRLLRRSADGYLNATFKFSTRFALGECSFEQ
jgi:uncharacterized UPF0146 family protein